LTDRNSLKAQYSARRDRMAAGACASVCVQRYPDKLPLHEVPAMITRVAIPLLLLPLLALALPLVFALAWIQEAISERVPRSQPPLIDG
jgi:hypothetical protein